MVKKEGSEATSSKKWLQVSRRRKACMVETRMLCTEQLVNVSCEDGIARRLKMKKRRKGLKQAIFTRTFFVS